MQPRSPSSGRFRPPTGRTRRTYAERLSRAIAQQVANSLRPRFRGIIPTEEGTGHESLARSSRGPKKLDVNYSTPELGLGLGVSIKTINYRDPGKSARYTKNYTRVDNELRAEAMDYHTRQPYAVMAALIFLPQDACDDGSDTTPSSFGAAVRAFRFRGGRRSPKDDSELFERIFLGLYNAEAARGDIWFFDVAESPPFAARPKKQLFDWDKVMDEIVAVYEARNDPPFRWSDRP
jgi:hypothetical protein